MQTQLPIENRRMSARKLLASAAAAAASALLLSGCWLKNIDTPYYTQDTGYWCGAATAQMILNSENMGIWEPSQADLYDYIHAHNQCATGWASDPKGLRDVLNKYAIDNGSSARFVYHVPSVQHQGNKKLAYTIDKYGVPPAALIYSCAHWIAVRGVITSDRPTTSPSYTLYGFYVNDPWYEADSLGENRYIAINSWNDDVFTACSGWCGASGNRYISVVDPLPPPRVKVAIPKPKPRQDSPIGAKKAQALAGSYLQTFLREQRYADVLNDAKRTVGGSALGDAVLVKRADRGKAGYYIVPLMRNSLTIGAILIDAYSGDLLEASFLEQPVRYVEVLAPEPAVRAFREQLPSLELNPALRDFLRSRSVSGTLPKPLAEPISPRSTVRPQAADWTSVLQQMVRRATQPTRPPKPTVVESDELQRQPRDDARTLVDFGIDRDQVKVEQVQLVWKPSAQSQNPYYPSWQIKGSIERMTQPVVLGYVDSRGKLSPRLTPPAELPLNGGGR